MEKYIKSLLFEHDCVIVPGFGGFLTQYISADIHPITHKFIPPSKRIAFNGQLKFNDGLLVSAVSEGEQISREDALHLINIFKEEITAKLLKGNLLELNDIGRFFYNKDNGLEFEPDLTVNYHEESFGLPELFFKPIERNFTAMNKPSNVEKPVKRISVESPDSSIAPKKRKPVVIVFALVFMLFGGAFTYLYFNQSNQDLASINPFVLLKGKEEKAVKLSGKVTPEPVAEIAPIDVEEPVNPEEIITSQTGRFFLVVGSFKSKENALKMKEKFESENQMVSIIEPYGKKDFYRVSIADFESKENAKAKMEELKPNFGNKIWVLTY